MVAWGNHKVMVLGQRQDSRCLVEFQWQQEAVLTDQHSQRVFASSEKGGDCSNQE